MADGGDRHGIGRHITARRIVPGLPDIVRRDTGHPATDPRWPYPPLPSRRAVVEGAGNPHNCLPDRGRAVDRPAEIFMMNDPPAR